MITCSSIIPVSCRRWLCPLVNHVSSAHFVYCIVYKMLIEKGCTAENSGNKIGSIGYAHYSQSTCRDQSACTSAISMESTCRT